MKQKIIIVAIISIVLAYVFFPKQKNIESLNIEKQPYSPFQIVIEGEVLFPGAYYFTNEVTLNEVIKMCGGFTSSADKVKVNTRTIFNSSQTIIIPQVSTNEEVTRKFDCNKVTFQELLTIPGMTETRAVSFLIYRTEVGKIKSVDELINVKNIGVVTLEKIRIYLYV